MRPPRQPFALDTPGFAFAAIATFASRASLGGAREIALAAYVTARLADDVVEARKIPASTRRARAAGARRWIATLAIAEPIRRTFSDLAAATETDSQATATALRRVIDVTSGILDAASRGDLEQLARDLESQTVGRT